ncbi:MAG: hypothetical protein OES38_17440, partial [Gammaproteobacteria bacterium]|nr:hypothetical protein [Gammaproteobacteria bacterium]
LDVLALNKALRGPDGMLGARLPFSVYSNYANVIADFTLELYDARDTDFSAALAQVSFEDWSEPVVVESGQLNLIGVDAIAYRLHAHGAAGSMDTTAVRLLAVSAEPEDVAPRVAREIWGHSNLDRQRIVLRGERVRVIGRVTEPVESIMFAGLRVPVADDGSFVIEQYLDAAEKPAFFARAERGRVASETHVTQIDKRSRRELVASVHFARLLSDDLASEMIDGSGAVAELSAYLEDLGPASEPRLDFDGHASSVPFVKGTARQLRYTHNAGLSSERAKLVSEFVKQNLDAGAAWRAGEVVGRGAPPPTPDECKPCNRRVDIYVTHNEVSERLVSVPAVVEPAVGIAEPPAEPESTMFVVGLANLTLGHNNLSGSVEALGGDEHFDDSIFVDGRVAMYAKGKIKGKYLITAQLDTTEDMLKNMGDNLQRKDPRRLFRQLDPDRYYPVYGDDSTAVSDVDTQGAYYVRVDWDKSSALWGNFETGLTDTEFAQHNRTLYGAKLDYASTDSTGFGEAKRSLEVFGSEATSVSAHVTFQATGGSLYFLNHRDIVQGSEKAWIEIRRRNSEQVQGSQDLIPGRDYEVDPIQGRIILRRPLAQVVRERSDTIVRSTPLEGDDVYLLVDYEYVPTDFGMDDLVVGGRGRVWLNDHVALGASKVDDQKQGRDYNLTGVDVTLRASEGSYVNIEYAESDARKSEDNTFSVDGGLSFSSQNVVTTSDGLRGEAVGVDARLDLSDVADDLDGEAKAWWKRRDAGFSSGRLREGREVTDFGVAADVAVSDALSLSAGYSELEEEGISLERVARVQADAKTGRFELGVEARYEDMETVFARMMQQRINDRTSRADNGDALLVGARVGYAVNDATTAFIQGQVSTAESDDYEDNDLITAGVSRQINEKTGVSLAVSDGDRGSAVVGGLNLVTGDNVDVSVSGGFGSGAISEFSTSYRVAEGHELYGSYAVDPDRSDGDRSLLTLGQRRQLGHHLQVFSESQFGKDDRYADIAHVFGLGFDGLRDWSVSASVQLGEHDTGPSEFERRVLSLSAGFDREATAFSTRFEYREDEGDSLHERQYLTSNAFSHRVDESRRWLGKLNLAWTDDEINSVKASRLVELDIGYAYRPVLNNRWNTLAKYSYL